MREEAAAEREQRLMDALAEALAHPAALGDALLVVALEPGLVRVGRALGQPGAMGEPEQDDELAVEVARDHRLEVELDVGRPGEALAVAQQAELAAVGDHAPEAVGAVQVILDQGVRALAGIAPAIELLVVGDDVDGRRALLVAGEVRDREARAAGLERGALVCRARNPACRAPAASTGRG